MIDYLRGTVGRRAEDHVVIDVGKTGKAGPDADAQGRIARIFFVPGPSWDEGHRYISGKQEYVWYLDDLELSAPSDSPKGAEE